jgi:hypothetical protein
MNKIKSSLIVSLLLTTINAYANDSSYTLVVGKVTDNEICVVGKIDPNTSKENEVDHTMADKSASMSCLKSSNNQSKLIGSWIEPSHSNEKEFQTFLRLLFQL